jgi:hypothetical protein
MSETTINSVSKDSSVPKNKKSANDQENRPRNNSPAFLAYESKKTACDARIADIRARIVTITALNLHNYTFAFYFVRTQLIMVIP